MAIAFLGNTAQAFVDASATSALQDVGAGTLSMWYRTTATAAFQTVAYVSAGGDVANFGKYRLGHDQSAILRAGRSARLDTDAQSSVGLAGGGFINTLNHRVVTINWATRAMTYYINGAQVATALMPTAGNTSNTVSHTATLGAVRTGVAPGTHLQYAAGLLELVELWDRVLTAVEINNLFLAKGKMISVPNLQSRWRLQELEPGGNFTDALQADSGIQKNNGIAGTNLNDVNYTEWLAGFRRARRAA